MKRLKKYLLFILLLILIPSVNAEECSNAEKVALGKEATAIKVGYEEKEGEYDPNVVAPPDGYTDGNHRVKYNYFIINFTNITENVYIEISNEEKNYDKKIFYSDAYNGKYSFDWKNINTTNRFEYSIIANVDSSCDGTVLKKGVLNLPAYNPYHTFSKCQDYPEFSLCQKYVNTNLTYDQFIKKLDKYIAQQEKKEEEKRKKEQASFLDNLVKFIKNNKMLVLIVSVVVTTIVGAIIILIVRNRKRRLI